MEFKIKHYHNRIVDGYCLELITDKEKGNGSMLENRVYCTIGEALIAQGLATLRYPNEESLTDHNVCEFEDILKGMLRLAFSTKVWGEPEDEIK